MHIPEYAAAIITALEQAGFEAYIVGGCVRDALMGVQPHDFDVATSALPAETKRVFEGCHVIETGIRHGTVTVISEGTPVEVTTFRVDGDYIDGRHPESVKFTRSLSDDLSRRDFTINGMAYSHRCGLVDLFGGKEDLQRRVIRCIGDPDRRFGEDALRIMRALRFSSVLGLEIEGNTARSARENRGLLNKISEERIFSELKQLLCGKNAERVLRQFPDIFTEIMPELVPKINYEQCSRYHNSTLYVHSARAVGAAEPGNAALRLAMLLHDCGKPNCRTADENGECHYYGHANISAQIADTILRRFKCDNATRERVCEIIKYHDTPVELSEKHLKRQLAKHGEECFRDIVMAHIADDMAKQEFCRDRIPKYREALAIAAEISARKPCLTVRELAVSGNDLKDIVPPSPELGKLLKRLLEEVLDGALANDRAALLKRARELSGM